MLAPVWSQNNFAEFITSANNYAKSDYSMFEYDIFQHFDNTDQVKLNSYYAQFGESWGEVVMALSMSLASRKQIGYVLTIYNRTEPKNWDKIAHELGIKKDTPSNKALIAIMNRQLAYWKKQITGN